MVIEGQISIGCVLTWVLWLFIGTIIDLQCNIKLLCSSYNVKCNNNSKVKKKEIGKEEEKKKKKGHLR